MGVWSKKARRPPAPWKEGKILNEDVVEYKRISFRIRRAVMRLGDFDPALDEPHIEAAAKAVIYMRRNEQFLDKAPEAQYAPGVRQGYGRPGEVEVDLG